MLVQHMLVTVLVFTTATLALQQCPDDTLVRLQYSDTISLVGMANVSDIPKCSNSTDLFQCCKCAEDELACSTIDDALAYVNSLVQTSSITGFELTLGKSDATNLLNLSGPYDLQGVDNVTIRGLGMTTVNCTEGAGIIFNATMSVIIQSISWCGCGPLATPKSGETGIYLPSGLVFLDCAQVTIVNANFSNFRSSAVFFDVHALPITQCSSEKCSPVASAQEGFAYLIKNSSFVGNGRVPTYYNTGISKVRGGAVYIVLTTSEANSITISDTTFVSNEADLGGAIYYDASDVHTYGNCSNSFFSIQHSHFLRNRASGKGGALLMASHQGVFNNCIFENNSANVGGGVHYTEFNDAPLCGNIGDQMRVIFESCTWVKNKAQASAALYFGTVSETYLADSAFMNSTFVGNVVNQIYFFDQSACVVYLYSVAVVFDGINAANGIGSALCLTSSSITLKGNNSFTGNQGFLGGGIYIQTSSQIWLAPGQISEFANNNALYGGAIYLNVILPQSQVCVFGFLNESVMSENDIHVKFVNNTAFVSGNSIYFVNATTVCQETFSKPNFVFLPEGSQLSSSAQTIKFLDPVYPVNGVDVINITLGISITLNAIVLDFISQPALTAVNAFIQDEHDQATPYSIVGSPSFTITNGSNSPNLSIAGPQILNESLSPYYLILLTPNIQKSIRLYMKPCPLGMMYNEPMQKCICYDEDELVCNNQTATVCIQDSYWLGKVNGSYTVALCSFGLCSTAYGICNKCPIDGASSYCEINETNYVCIGNHSGILCGDCVDSFSPVFLSTHCVNSTSCNVGNAVSLVAINMSFLVIILCLFVIILKLDYRIGSGYLFGVFYYYSIVIHLLPPNAVGEPLLIIAAVLQEVTQLNPRLLGYIDLCFSETNWTIVEYVLCYLNPVILAVFVFVAIRLIKCCPRYVVFSDSTPVRAICLLVISSFATFTEISFNIISPVIMEGINETRVNIQPSVKFLDLIHHLPWFVISICVIVFAILPFTLLLFLTPFLVRCIDLNRIKPFLDEFQGCFKDNLRWMAGFYFLCRIVYLALLTSASAGLKTTQYGIQFLSLIILLIHVILQPYESRFLNVVDSVILADLMILTLLFGQTANLVFKSTEYIRLALTYILILIPVVYVLFLALLALATKLSKKYPFGENFFFRTFRMPNTGKTDSATFQYSRFVNRDRDDQYRESLLHVLEDAETLNEPSGSSKPRLSSVKAPSRSTQPIAYGATAQVQINKGQTVIERPLDSMSQSAVVEKSAVSPD